MSVAWGVVAVDIRSICRPDLSSWSLHQTQAATYRAIVCCSLGYNKGENSCSIECSVLAWLPSRQLNRLRSNVYVAGQECEDSHGLARRHPMLDNGR